MTTPSTTVLDAINDAAGAFVILDGAFPSSVSVAVQQKLHAAQQRAAAAFAEIAAYYDRTAAQLAGDCRSRPTFSGGIDC